MSTLRVDNLQNTSGNSSPINVPGGAKAWVYFEMVDPSSIVASYNVSSITDQAVGRTRINFNNALSSSSYCVVAGGFNQGGGDGSWNSVYGGSSTGATNSGQTTTYVDTAQYNSSGSFQDQFWAMFAVFGN